MQKWFPVASGRAIASYLPHFGMLIFFIFFNSGCAVTKVTRGEVPAAIPAVEIREDAPVQIRVIDEFNDGQTLFVKAAVRALTTWGADDIKVQLHGLHDGQMVREISQPLQSIVSASEFAEIAGVKVLPVDRELALLISIPSEGVTDYQLEVLWGDDLLEEKEAVLDATFTLTARTDAMLGDVSNGREPVGVIEGILSNPTSQVLESVVLVIGDLSDEVVPLSGLSLAAGASTKIRLSVPPDWDLSGVHVSILRSIFASESGSEISEKLPGPINRQKTSLVE